MTVDPDRSYRRWQAAEADGRDDEADAEFKVVFDSAVSTQVVGASFTARTMEAVAAAAANEARRSRRTRVATIAAGLAGGVAAAYFGAGLLVTLLSTGVMRGFDLLIGLVVRMAGAAQTGADLWSVLSGMGRAAVAFAADPTVTMMLFALQGIAVAALIALQRLLGADEESLK
jgi:hypothetical protein